MESIYSSDHGREGRRDLRIGSVCVVLLPVHYVRVNCGVKRIFYLARGAAELDGHPALAYAVHAKTVRSEPSREFLNIRWGNAKSFAELIGRKPGVEVRGGFVLLAGDKTLQRGFRRRVASQNQQHAFHGEIRGGFSAIIGGRRQGMTIAVQNNE
jgi:hypothetical protein